jgi:error-prone DNA polymerase
LGGGAELFAHLHVHSLYSMQDGASRIEALMDKAVVEGIKAMAITDHDTVAGVISWQRIAKARGIHPVSGVELTLQAGGRIVLLARDATGYETICRLLTIAYGRNRIAPQTTDQALEECNSGVFALTGGRFSDVTQYLLAGRKDQAIRRLQLYRSWFGGMLRVALIRTELPGDRRVIRWLRELARTFSIPTVVTGDVHYACKSDFPAHDLLVCVRTGTTLDETHPERPLNCENDLKGEHEMRALFADDPESVDEAGRVAWACAPTPCLDGDLFPAFFAEGMSHGARVRHLTLDAPACPAGRQAQADHGAAANRQLLRRLTYEGAAQRYDRIDRKLRERLDHELGIIAQLGYVDYFLIVWDIAAYARSQGIRYAGRGSAADSAVAFCLYITDVDAAGRNLLFERFMSLERAEKPDIDIDFEADRRDEVRDYVYRRYGADHVGSVCTYSTFRARAAIRDLGAALALPQALCDALARRTPYMLHADSLAGALQRYPELRELSVDPKRLRLLLRMAEHLAGFPRYFGMHVGGVVISRKPLLQITSLQPSAKGPLLVAFDKDGVEDAGLVKLDLLSLRTMSAIQGTLRNLEQTGRAVDYDRVSLDDQETFEMIARGETIGAFQLESPAQRALQSRLGAAKLEDIVASVALIRPGPIKGNMVDPFLERRHGREQTTYMHPKLEPILAKTYGVVLFQEQVIEIATAIADFTPGEADRLRRVMSHARSAREMEEIGAEFVAKAAAAGVDAVVADTIFSYIRGYASYGFCEAHAAAFATTAYKTAYLSRHFPAEYFAALLAAQPMGYYPVHVLVAEVRARGVRILPLDVNESMQVALGAGDVLRPGLLQVAGVRRTSADAVVHQREQGGPYRSLEDFCRRLPTIDRMQVERLIQAGGFDSLFSNRRALLWSLPIWMPAVHTQGRRGGVRGASTAAQQAWRAPTQPVRVADFTRLERVALEYRWLGFGISDHWMALFRDDLRTRGVELIRDARVRGERQMVTVAGIAIRPHRPPTKSGKTVVFFTLEDESGMLDVTMFQDVYQRCGAALFRPQRGVIAVQGVMQQRQGGAPALLARRVWAYQPAYTPCSAQDHTQNSDCKEELDHAEITDSAWAWDPDRDEG